MNDRLVKLSKTILILSVFTFTTACSGSFNSKSLYVDGNAVKEEDPRNPVDTSLKFCSPLSFEHVTWNQSISPQGRRSFAIALSISGRFEGRAGWANLTNNFDGQGMSAGLLNQTLGTGSLQPLLWQMRTNSLSDFASAFSATNEISISTMLADWNTNNTSNPANTFGEIEDFHISEKSSLTTFASSATNASVQWAVSTLYKSNGSFKDDWKKQMQSLLQKPSYISIQIGAAEKIHNRALKYVKRVGIDDLRTYLLMFDILVQNGSITETRFKEWEAAVKAENLTSTVEILKKLVDIRLQDTKPEWVNDVRTRKYALVDGHGTVHGEQLNLTTSYCYSSSDKVQ